jgi:ATP-dependent helicase Lhr and Lhr-like helicase
MEEAGKLRRGYFVEGVAAMQFALPGSEDRLRSIRTSFERPQVARRSTADALRILASTDPANVYGAAIAWPRSGEGTEPRLERSAGTWVALRHGRLVAFIGKSHRSIATLAPLSPDDRTELAQALATRAKGDWGPALLIERVDGRAARSSGLADALVAAGFRPSGSDGLLYVASVSAYQSEHT